MGQSGDGGAGSRFLTGLSDQFGMTRKAYAAKGAEGLVNPGRPIPQEATDVHKITDDDVKDAPTFEGVAAEVAAMLAGCVPAAYNAAFDFNGDGFVNALDNRHFGNQVGMNWNGDGFTATI